MLSALGAGQPQGFMRRHYCLRCQGIWQSVEVPATFLNELRSYGQRIEELHRQIAVLRFLLASLRQQRAESARSDGEFITTERDPPADGGFGGPPLPPLTKAGSRKAA